MINDPKIRDPYFPHNPGIGDTRERRFADAPELHSGSGRTSFAIAIMLIALLVAGVVVFSGTTEIDPTHTASPGIDRQTQTLPGNSPVTPSPEPAVPAD